MHMSDGEVKKIRRNQTGSKEDVILILYQVINLFDQIYIKNSKYYYLYMILNNYNYTVESKYIYLFRVINVNNIFYKLISQT